MAIFEKRYTKEEGDTAQLTAFLFLRYISNELDAYLHDEDPMTNEPDHYYAYVDYSCGDEYDVEVVYNESRDEWVCTACRPAFY